MADPEKTEGVEPTTVTIPKEKLKTPVTEKPPARSATQLIWDRAKAVEDAHNAMDVAKKRGTTDDILSVAKVPPAPKFPEAKKRARGPAPISVDDAKALQPFKGDYSDNELLQLYRTETGDEEIALEDFDPATGGIQQAAQEAPSLFGIQPQEEAPEGGYDDRPGEGQYAPIQGGGITMQDGSIQKGSSEYPIGPAYARLGTDFEAENPDSKFVVYSQHGAIRSADSNFQRILQNKRHWRNYFTPEAIAGGNPTKADLLPGKWQDLQRSPHVHAEAADIMLNANVAEFGTVTGKDGKQYPSNAAMANSPQGKWMYADNAYNLLVRGWIPRGKGYANRTGITDPNAPDRQELWHIEYNPEAANEELRRLGYLDKDGFLIPPKGDTTSRNADIIAEAGATSIYHQTSDERLAEMETIVADEIRDLGRGPKEESRGRKFARLVSKYEKAEADVNKAVAEYGPEILRLTDIENKAKEDTARAKQKATALETSLRDMQSGMAKGVAADIEEHDRLRIEKTNRIMADMEAATKRVRDMDVNAFRMFQFIETKKDKDGNVIKDENGKAVTEVNNLKAGLTIAAAIALIANAFFTFQSSARKKGNKVPFLAWDMILQAMNLDLRNQEAALDGEQAELNAEYNRLNYWNKYFDDKDAAKLKQKDLFLDYVETEILKHTAHWKDVDAQGAIKTILAKKSEEQAATKAALAERVAINAGRDMTNSLGAMQKREAIITQKQSILIKAWAARGTAAARKKKLAPEEKAARNQAFKFLPLAKELKTLWRKSGTDVNIVLKAIASSGLGTLLPTTVGDFDVPYGQEIQDLTRIREIRQQYAAVLTKAMGETGALAEKEQLRAMTQIPLGDHSELGMWKMDRLIASMNLLASDEYYLMDSQTRRRLADEILAQPDTLAGVKRATEIMNSVTQLWDPQGTKFQIRSERQVSREAEGRMGAQGQTQRLQGQRGTNVYQGGPMKDMTDEEVDKFRKATRARMKIRQSKKQKENLRRLREKEGARTQPVGQHPGRSVR
tara:strand:- start:1779 stop:4832 length:3054 start_codon:yes stop_codon:yes gene_type:complete